MISIRDWSCGSEAKCCLISVAAFYLRPYAFAVNKYNDITSLI